LIDWRDSFKCKVERVAVAVAVSKQALECYVTGPNAEATASREGGAAAAAVRKQASKMIKKNDTKKKRKQKISDSWCKRTNAVSERGYHQKNNRLWELLIVRTTHKKKEKQE